MNKTLAIANMLSVMEDIVKNEENLCQATAPQI